jgi:hypothetical protein
MLLAGCAEDGASAQPQPSAAVTSPSAAAASAPPATTAPPTAPAGACLLLDFTKVEERLGAGLEISGAATHEKTNTCVARPTEAALPELSLSVTPTKADVAVFKAAMLPDGATAVAELGRVAYQQVRPAAKGRGPYVEVGWLAGNARLLVLKVTLPVGGDGAAALPGVLALAKDIDRAGV